MQPRVAAILIGLSLLGVGLAQHTPANPAPSVRQPLPLVRPSLPPSLPPGAVQPNAPGQRAAEPLPTLSIVPLNPEVKKIEYASNGFIEVAHALILVPKTQDTLARAIELSQAAVSRAFMARPTLSEVDVSVYQAESHAGFGGPLPRFTASVPKARLASFQSLTRDTLGGFDRAWANPSSLAQYPRRAPTPDLEQTPVFQGSAADLRDQQVRQLSSQLGGGTRSGVFFHGDPAKPFVALTFDDAPHPLYEPLLLDTLRRAGVKATFFCIGRNARAYPYFVRDMVAQGHEVGNHTYHHVRLPPLSDADAREELEEANTALQDITDQPVRFFRPPGGDYSRATLRISAQLGLTTAFWTDDPGDFDNIGDARLESKLIRRLRRGGIVLLHDNVLETVQILPDFLRVARGRGLNLTTLGKLVIESWN